MFNPARLTLARRRRKYTKKGLAEALGLDQKTVIRYESGEVEPPAQVIHQLAGVLAFPNSFFFGTDIDEPMADAVSFRALRTIPARDRDAAVAAGALAYLVANWVDARFELPSAAMPEYKEASDPESAARTLRQEWGLGERPIRNMVHLLEAKGVRVFSLRDEARAVDAFSMWRRDVPFVFLSSAKTAERSRFDAAHELGHLVLHRHGGPGGRVAEDQANHFGSAFLMPRSDVLARLPRLHRLDQIVHAKQRWGVSVAALNYRLHQLGVTSEWQYRTFCIQINERRFHVTEPQPMIREMSQVWEKVFAALKGEGIGKHTIARDVALPVSELENLLFMLTRMQGIEGTGAVVSAPRGKLSLVIASGTDEDHVTKTA